MIDILEKHKSGKIRVVASKHSWSGLIETVPLGARWYHGATKPSSDETGYIVGAASIEDEPIARTDCFFCLHHSSNMEKNAIHMATEHSFFLPDVEYLVDMPGLFEYLGAKVKAQIFLACITYSESVFLGALGDSQ